MNRTRCTGTVLIALAATALVGCGPRGEVLTPEARIYRVEVTGGGTELALSIDICSRPLRSLTVEETPDEVRVTAMTDRGRDPNDCALSVTRRLDEPLGDRVIIDTSTGDPIDDIDVLDG